MHNSEVRIRINERLLDEARARASQQRMTLSEFVRASVRTQLAAAA